MSSPADPYAAQASAALGGGSSLARAIEALWVCENGDAWPPPDNNPGNITIPALTSNGIVSGYTTGRNVSGHVFARYPDLSSGVAGFVLFVQRSPRWVAARAAARADNGYGFITGIAAGGWGTRLSCMASAYRSGRAPAGSAGASSSSSGIVPAVASSSSSSTAQLLAATIGPYVGTGSWYSFITDALAGKVAGWGQADLIRLENAITSSGQPPRATLTQASVDAVTAQLNAYPDAGKPGPDLFAGLGSALAPLLVNGAVLLVILVLAWQGLERVLEA